MVVAEISLHIAECTHDAAFNRDKTILALSGMRTHELARIKVADVGDLGLSMISMYAGQEPLTAKAALSGR
jgi:hypothetical protein